MLSSIFFITSSDYKFGELAEHISGLGRLSLDLPEVQAMESIEVIREKLRAAAELGYKDVLVEDTSLHIESLGGLPGPLAKWFVKALGVERLANLASSAGSTKAAAISVIGARLDGEEIIVEGKTAGRIVAPRGAGGFGWDAIFEPEGERRTFAEMTSDEKSIHSMRVKAAKGFLAAATKRS